MTPDEKFAVELILEQIIDTKDGELITYSELSALTGLDIQFSHRHVLDRALAIALDEHNCLFDNERNVGYRRLSDVDEVRRLKNMKRIRNLADRDAKRLSKVSYNDLEESDRSYHNAKFAVLALVRNIATGKTVMKIEHKIDGDMSAVNVQKLLEVLSGSG